MRIAIATVQVPFMQGGAEALAEGLQEASLQAGHQADIISLPFRFSPESEILRSMQVWESEDFTKLNCYEPDRVICLTFPSFYLNHPVKHCWVLHQFRMAYDLHDPQNPQSLSDATRRLITERDTEHLTHCQGLFALSHTVAERLARYNGLKAELLYHPPPSADQFYSAPHQPYIFSPSRLESLKRQDLLIEAMRHVKAPVWAIIAGMGGQYGHFKEMVRLYKLEDRVRLVGYLSPEELRAFYANALAIFFGPKDEDYGYITLESMLACKPVITCTDSGGPLEFISHESEGLIVEPDAKAIADAIDRLAGHPVEAMKIGINGRAKYDSLELSWNKVLEALLN